MGWRRRHAEKESGGGISTGEEAAKEGKDRVGDGSDCGGSRGHWGSIGKLGRAILWWLDQLNAHLAMLVELRVEEVWGPRVYSDLGVDDIRDELMALKVQSMDKEKEVIRKR